MSLSAPDSEVDICNLSLTALKQAHVAQIDPAGTQLERTLALWYPQIRRSTLRSHIWNFAKKRIQLTPSSPAAPPFGFTHAYLKPSDWLRFVGRYDDEGNRLTLDDYDLEGDYILLNGEDNSAVNFIYISDFTNVVKFDSLFVELFAINLAVAICPSFMGSESRIGTLLEQQREIQARATAVDGQERPPRRVQNSRFIAARQSGRRVAGKYTQFSG